MFSPALAGVGRSATLVPLGSTPVFPVVGGLGSGEESALPVPIGASLSRIRSFCQFRCCYAWACGSLARTSGDRAHAARLMAWGGEPMHALARRCRQQEPVVGFVAAHRCAVDSTVDRQRLSAAIASRERHRSRPRGLRPLFNVRKSGFLLSAIAAGHIGAHRGSPRPLLRLCSVNGHSFWKDDPRLRAPRPEMLAWSDP